MLPIVDAETIAFVGKGSTLIFLLLIGESLVSLNKGA